MTIHVQSPGRSGQILCNGFLSDRKNTLVQAAAKQELQGVLEVCSRSFSAWFMAHVPDLLARHPTAPATLGRFLPHFGADQVHICIKLPY